MVTDEYIAGFFDGEGSVSITAELHVQVAIAQKKPEILKLIRMKYGGNISVAKNKKYQRSCYCLRITDKEKILVFLKAIQRYSVVKKEEIEICIKATELINSGNEERFERQNLRMELQNLRPSKTFKNLQSAEYLYRQSIKERFGFKCCVCGLDMKDIIINHHVVVNDKLWCRKCYEQSKPHIEFKPRSKEMIEQVLSETKSLDEACSILKIGRCALLKKRKRLGLPMLRVTDRILTKEMVEKVLLGNRTLGEAAKSLGIDRKSLWKKRKEFKILQSGSG